MKIFIYHGLKLMLLVLLVPFCNSETSEDQNTYVAQKIWTPIDLDGLADEKSWSHAIDLSDFTYPWETINAPTTRFKSVYDEENLYFYFYAEDDDIRLKQSGDEEMDAVASDRIEIFIRSSDETKPYYSFEMDPQGRVFDSKGEFGKYIDKDYDFPRSDFDFVGDIKSDSYTVEGKFSLSVLKEMELLVDNTIMIGLYRGEYLLDENGEPITKWISWIIPDSEKPNFHIPSSFGKLKLH